MISRHVCIALSVVLSSPLAAQSEFVATVAGHALLPAQTLIPAPGDAPVFLQSAGKFAVTEEPARSTDAPTDGQSLPFDGQPVQGFSGIRHLGDGRYLVLTDNGFGTQANSPDAMLMFHEIEPNFDTGDVKVLKTTFLQDPDSLVPFLLTTEASEQRYLTGGDLDLEGIQPIGDLFYLGDEFGPFLLAADSSGRIVEFHESFIDETEIQSPDNYKTVTPDPDGELTFNLKRSRGYEGLAASTDGNLLFPMLEGALYDRETGNFENLDGRQFVRILEFSVTDSDWTGRSFRYVLENDEHAIGDFNFIDETRALVIERDGGQGDASLACEGDRTEGCFENPARFKRVYLIDFDGVEDGGTVRKVAFLDLLNMADPDGIARSGQRDDGTFSFPFVTIENVDRVDETHIVVANDNNFPFSKGRDVVERDDNEFVLLEVEAFLQAK